MAKDTRLSPTARKIIAKLVEEMFKKIKARFLGPEAENVGGKHIIISFKPDLTLSALFNAAAKEEGVKPNEELLQGLNNIAASYLDAQKEKTKAKVIHATQSFLIDATSKGVKTDVPTVLGGELSKVYGEVTKDVKRILETETTTARNVSIFDAIGKIAAGTNQEDPTVFFVTVNDTSRCTECTRLHVMPDGFTPRVWKKSQLGAGYHKKGQDNPKIGGLHPHCRCILTILFPGYGFNADGRVTYKKPGYDEYAVQRGTT